MANVDLTEQEWQQLLNILGTTKEHPWVVTNPLLMKIGDQLNKQRPAPIMTTERAWTSDGKEKHQ